MKVYVVIDTNVLVSALLSRHRDSATSIILANLFSETIVPLYNDEILTDNLLRAVVFPDEFIYLHPDILLESSR